jgi:hypothetical protein
MKVFKKSDEDRLDYFLDLSEWMPVNDEIESVELVYDKKTALNDYGYNFNSTGIRVWLGDGKAGEQYPIKVLAFTEGGRTKEINFLLVVTEQ